MQLLERFLLRLVCHPVLTEDKHVRVFLTANATVSTTAREQSWRVYKKTLWNYVVKVVNTTILFWHYKNIYRFYLLFNATHNMLVITKSISVLNKEIIYHVLFNTN